MTQAKRLRALFTPLDAVGHVNSCVGLAQALLRRGHEVIFFIDEIWRNKLDSYGFTLVYYQDPSRAEQNKQSGDAGKAWAKIFKDIGILGEGVRDPKSLVRNTLKMNKFVFNFDRLVEVETQLAKAIEKHQPDIFLVDNLYVSPHILYSGKPYVLVASPYPVFYGKFENVPPALSGLPTDGDRSEWAEFEAILEEFFKDELISKVATHFGYPPIADNRKFPLDSAKLTVFAYPREVLHPNFHPPESWVNVESFMREEHQVSDFVVPKQLEAVVDRYPGKLIYLSLGSMGSYDVTLMERLVRILANTKHRYIVSKGPRHEEYQLAENMWGDRYLPQTAVLKVVDLVITHGGNNTFTETMMHGVPMIVMPLFGDQPDNATRLSESGLGASLDPYNFEDAELVNAIERTLNNDVALTQIKGIAQRINSYDRFAEACSRIEKCVFSCCSN